MQVLALPPGPTLGAFAAALAAVAWILGRWRDLTPIAVGVAAAALAVDRAAPTAIGVGAAAVLLVGASARTSRAGVSRPELGAATVAASIPAVFLASGAPVAAAAWCAVWGALLTVPALDGRVGASRVRWIGRIPIEQGPPER